MAGHNSSPTDFGLHGLVGIRLLDAGPPEVAMITRQLGPIQRPLDREPDITIRFVEHLSLPRLRLLGVDDSGFSDDAFVVLRSKHKSRAKVRIPLDAIGQGCEIVAERGLTDIPHLVAIVNLTMVSKDMLPLHASAFEYRGVGALATGWAKGGKTEMLLAYAAHGARYVGDEWVYVARDGQRMYGLPEPIRLWKWHFEAMPEYWEQLARGERAKLEGLNLLSRSMDRVAYGPLGRILPPLTTLRRAAPIVQRQLNVQVPPERLFEGSIGPSVSTPHKLFYVASHDAPEIVVAAADPADIARRMVFSFIEEHADLLSAYRKFRFAFPERHSDLFDTLEERVRALLLSALADKDTHAVFHPHPVAIPALYDATHSLFPAS